MLLLLRGVVVSPPYPSLFLYIHHFNLKHKVKAMNLEVIGCHTSNRELEDGADVEGGSGLRVMAFWGDARWSRSQLLGEVRGVFCSYVHML